MCAAIPSFYMGARNLNSGPLLEQQALYQLSYLPRLKSLQFLKQFVKLLEYLFGKEDIENIQMKKNTGSILLLCIYEN